MASITVTAPTPGSVYRRPSPEADPFVEVGDQVKPGQVLCLVEVMKTFLEVKAEQAGEIAEILFEDEQFINEGDPLITITTE